MHPADDVDIDTSWESWKRLWKLGWVKMDELIQICGEDFARAVTSEPIRIPRCEVQQGKDWVVEYLITDASLHFYAGGLYADFLPEVAA